MPLLQYETQIAEDGSITLPRLPEYRERKIVVIVQDGEPKEESKTSLDDFIDFCASRHVSSITDEEIDQVKYG